jgi:outer membrane protein with beta-barrel domain
MKKICCFLALAFLFAPAKGFASDLTIFGGLQRQGKITLRQGVSNVPTLFDSKNFGLFGIRAGIGKKMLGTETSFGYTSSFIDSRMKAVILNQNLMVQVPTPAVRPYATVGVGTIITKGTGITDIGTKFAVNYGGGLKVSLAGPVGARVDIRNYTVPSVQSQTLNVFEMSLGIVFFFGGDHR